MELNFQAKHSFRTSKGAKGDEFSGNIFETTSQFMKHFKQEKRKPDEKEIKKRLGKVEGRWTKYISFDSERIQLDEVVLYEMNGEENSLPSDSLFREDINFLKIGRL